jgi:hypothetical protein
MTGHDATYAQTVHVRHMYQPMDNRFGHRFVDVASRSKEGRMRIDYGKFHDTQPDPGEPAGPCGVVSSSPVQKVKTKGTRPSEVPLISSSTACSPGR